MSQEDAADTYGDSMLEALGLDDTREPGWMELLHLLAERDAETAGHCDRVARYCLKVAGILGLTLEERHTLFLAARLHDIGKLLVPAHVLQKPGRLNPAEWGIVRQHPAHGEYLAVVAGLTPDVCAVIRHHHERWDGDGYPDRLEGHRIPRLARILAAADALDAMTQKRSYRFALTFDDALRELCKASGTQLDPAAVAALVALPVESFQGGNYQHGIS